MAERSGLSKSTIGRIWRRLDLKPHLIDGFKEFLAGSGLVARSRRHPRPSSQ